MKPQSLILFCLAWLISPGTATGQGTAFTYHGQLTDVGRPANGVYDLRFALYDALTNGGAVGGPLTNGATAVSNGLFTVTLDFGSAPFTGADRWLEIGVRTNGGVGFTTLSPRQQLMATPYAIRAVAAGSVPTGTITSAMLADGAVTTAKLAPVLSRN